MIKKLYTSAMAAIMLVTILSAAFSVNAENTLNITAAPRGTLIVHVLSMNNTTIPDAIVTAIKNYNGTQYNVPYQNATQTYVRSLPVGDYLIKAQWNSQTKTDIAYIGKNQVVHRWFVF